MPKALLQLLAVIGTLQIATAQFVIEYDYNFHNPVGRINNKPRKYYKYEAHFSRKQCPDIASYKGNSPGWCKKKCDEAAKCTAFNYFNKQSRNGVKCILKACDSNPPYPTGQGKGVTCYSLKQIEEPPSFKDAPNLVFNKRKVIVGLDTSVQLPCGYSPPESIIRRCLWKTPNNTDLQVKDILDNVHPGLGIPSIRYLNQCGIVLDQVSQVDIGKWTCKIFIKGKTLRGTIELIQDKQKKKLSYSGYSGLFFARKQCKEIGLYEGKSLDWCQKKCDKISKCSAFNHLSLTGHKGEKCSLRACGRKPPYPVGDGNARGEWQWQGYSLKEIEKGYTRYNGPHSKIWESAQGCGHIQPPTLREKSYVECEQVCNRDPSCTGFNFNLKKYDCELFRCNDPTLAPERNLADWEGWSKRKIKEHTSVYFHYDFLWTDIQCRIIDTYKGVSRRECEDICDAHSGCTAFNWKIKSACELRQCSSTPPYPIGEIKGWKGYSTHWITTGGRYFGPYGEYWEDNQCDEIGIFNDKTRVDCESICDRVSGCSGFNFNIDNGNCVMRKCAKPTLPKGLEREWESYSKTKFTEPLLPHVKCPSVHCKEKNIPADQLTWTPTAVNRYCRTRSCKCQIDVFCYFKCDKCRI